MHPKPNTLIHRSTRIAAVIAALTVGASAYASEALEIELPSMRTPVHAIDGGLTRQQVRAELMAAREAGTLTQLGEAGDTTEVLSARENFNAAQGQAIMARYQAEQARDLALQEAEGALTQTMTLADGNFVLDTSGATADTGDAGDAAQVHIEIIDLNTSDTAVSPEGLVVVSMEGGDPATRRQQALAIRRQLIAMGLASEQIYIESTDLRV